jgi:hypothetical protein
LTRPRNWKKRRKKNKGAKVKKKIKGTTIGEE